MKDKLKEVYDGANLHMLGTQLGFLEEIALKNENNLAESAAWLAVFLRNLHALFSSEVSPELFKKHRLAFLSHYGNPDNANELSEGINNFLDCIVDALVEDTGNEDFLISEDED